MWKPLQFPLLSLILRSRFPQKPSLWSAAASDCACVGGQPCLSQRKQWNTDGYHRREQSRNKAVIECVLVWKKVAVEEGWSRSTDLYHPEAPFTGAGVKCALVVWNSSLKLSWCGFPGKDHSHLGKVCLGQPESLVITSVIEHPCKRQAKKLRGGTGELARDDVLWVWNFWSWTGKTDTQKRKNKGTPFSQLIEHQQWW